MAAGRDGMTELRPDWGHVVLAILGTMLAALRVELVSVSLAATGRSNVFWGRQALLGGGMPAV